jgi:hypothetical protein
MARRHETMANSSSSPEHNQDDQTRKFLESLVKTGQLVDVHPGEDTSKLPARVTHVRYPDGTVKRIRFTGSGYR